MRPPIQRAQREGQPQASTSAPQASEKTRQASTSTPQGGIPNPHNLPATGLTKNIPSPHSHPPARSTKGQTEAEARGSALASLGEPPVRDIPRGADCRPSAPPLVSLSSAHRVCVAIRGLWEGRPCRASIIVGTDEPRVWSPLQGYAPWALRRVAPLGLAPPPGNWPRSATSEIVIPHPALHGIKGPRYRKEPLCGKGPYCGSPPCRASGLWTRANPGFGRPCRATHPGL